MNRPVKHATRALHGVGGELMSHIVNPAKESWNETGLKFRFNVEKLCEINQ